MFVYPDFSNVNDTSIMELTQQNYTLMAIGTVLLVPVVEETLYRGVVFGSLYKRSRVAAYTVSTLAVEIECGDLNIIANVKVVRASDVRAGAEFINLEESAANKLLYVNMLLEAANSSISYK